MNSDDGSGAYTIYPRRYFDASPTWFAWNKLTAADVHTLHEEQGFEGQNIYFRLNHPIQYVRLVGLVAGVESIANTRFTLVTLDDCSGANIEIKIIGRDVKFGDDARYPSNTEIDNLDVVTEMGLPQIFIDRHAVHVGTIIRAQGTISTFRNTRQLVLKRVWRVQDTNEEALLWSKVAEWKRTVLAQPWRLTEEERASIDRKTGEREEADRVNAEERRKLSAHALKKKQKHLAKREAKRQLQENEMNAGALKGSNLLHMPWD